AYEKVVDRLLRSPRYGERMAARWLDAARYADTNGYQTDAERVMWRWRDWVIDAFNRNLPFDQFTIEQIAGDMLPGATLSQKIASGFNRNHRANSEGGIIPEEYLVEYVVDRVETTSTVWLGLTLGCARCHDHKYDPVTQKEFYQVYGYFNNIPERGRAFKFGNTPPLVPAPTPDQVARLAELDRELAAGEKQFDEMRPAIARAQREWEKSLAAAPRIEGQLARDLALHHSGGELDGSRFVDAGDQANFGFLDAFTVSAWIHPSAPTGAIVTRTTDTPEGDGYGLWLTGGKVYLSLVQRWLDDALRVETRDPVSLNQWHHVLATYDGTRMASGIRIFIDGVPAPLRVLLDDLNQNFAIKEPLRIGGGGGPENRFRGSIADVRIYKVALPAEQAAVVATRAPLDELAAIVPEKRTPSQAAKLAGHFLDAAGPQPMREAWSRLLDV
ncbi:MAG: DUF1549 domain-containing protein, partial [Bryobacteraceae bacterium]